MASWALGGQLVGPCGCASRRWCGQTALGGSGRQTDERRRLRLLGSRARVSRRRSAVDLVLELEHPPDRPRGSTPSAGQPLHLAQQGDVAQRSSAGRRPAVRPGETRPSRSYWRSVCACSPVSWAATEMTKTGDSSVRSNGSVIGCLVAPRCRACVEQAGPRVVARRRVAVGLERPRAPRRRPCCGTATSTVTSRSPRGAVLAGDALALDPERAAVGRAGRDPQGHRLARRASARLISRAERRLGEGDRHRRG